MIAQLEVGSDTPSFSQALRQAMRQDPDVMLVGELRDVETLRMAFQAADTGHQVFSTVHSATAAQTVERIIAMFPPAEHKLLLCATRRLDRGHHFAAAGADPRRQTAAGGRDPSRQRRDAKTHLWRIGWSN